MSTIVNKGSVPSTVMFIVNAAASADLCLIIHSLMHFHAVRQSAPAVPCLERITALTTFSVKSTKYGGNADSRNMPFMHTVIMVDLFRQAILLSDIV